nr:carboxypeptidase-like regulatory domain-containing protein [bacterium]
AGGDIPGVDFVLDPGSTVQGAVSLSRNGDPFPGTAIVMFSEDGREQPLHSVETDSDGSYLAFGIPAGIYCIQADAPWGCGARDVFFPDAFEFSAAQPIQVGTATSVTGIDMALPEGNFDLNIALRMPRRWVDPGEVFGLTMTVDNDGPLLTDLPVFLLLDIQGAIYFWPSWSLWSPPEATGLDFMAASLPEAASEIVILPEFIWPQLGFDMDGLRFIGAITNWSMTDLASDVEIEEWSFDGNP